MIGIKIFVVLWKERFHKLFSVIIYFLGNKFLGVYLAVKCDRGDSLKGLARGAGATFRPERELEKSESEISPGPCALAPSPACSQSELNRGILSR